MRKRSGIPYEGSKHYLHRAYLAGHEAAQNMPVGVSRNEEDAECPYCSGTPEYTWWWGMLKKLFKYIWALFLEMEDAALFTDDFVNGDAGPDGTRT